MTYDAQRVLVGREPLTVVDVILGACSLTYGIAPCTASGGAGAECYNTRFTCQDTANYTATTKTYRFCERRYQPEPGTQMYPALVRWSVAPSMLTPGKGLGHRASVTLTFQDFPHHDRGIDNYADNRAAAPSGTFFGRFVARNPYYRSRLIKIRQGYVASDGLDLDADFRDHVYVIDKIDGPDASGRVTITAKDMLKLVDDKRAKAPSASAGRLAADIDDSTTSATLDDATGYAASGHLRIGSEIMSFTRSGTALTVTRAQWGTTASSHTSGDTVQESVVYDSTTTANVVDVTYDLLNTYTTVDAATYIDYGDDQTYTRGVGSTLNIVGHTFSGNEEVYVTTTGTHISGLASNVRYFVIVVNVDHISLASERNGSAIALSGTGSGTQTIHYAWIYEKEQWLTGKNTKAILSAPIGVNKLLGELTEQFGFSIWWDEDLQKIRLKALAPARFGTTTLSAPLADSAKAVQKIEDRLSQVWVYYDRIDSSQDGNDKENFRQVLIAAALEKEGDDLYTEPSIKEIFSRWTDSQGVVSSGASRALNRFAETPVELTFRLDAGATLPEVAEECTISTRAVQSTDGTDAAFNCQILSRDEVEPGSVFEFRALTSAFTIGRYAFISATGTADYTSATGSDQDLYAWICVTSSELMSNGDPPYRMA